MRRKKKSKYGSEEDQTYPLFCSFAKRLIRSMNRTSWMRMKALRAISNSIFDRAEMANARQSDGGTPAMKTKRAWSHESQMAAMERSIEHTPVVRYLNMPLGKRAGSHAARCSDAWMDLGELQPFSWPQSADRKFETLQFKGGGVGTPVLSR